MQSEAIFERLMEPHFSALYARACQLTGNVADAEDLVQDLCIRVFPRIEELRSLDNPRTWLLRVLYRLFVDLRRRERRSPLQSIDSVSADDPVFEDASSPDPERHTEAAQMHRRLERAWRTLDDEQRVLLVLQGIEGHSLAEIEEITGIRQGTLKSRLHRARARLGRLLEREEHPGGPAAGGTDDELPRRLKSIG